MVVKIDAHSTETLCFQLIADFLIFPLKGSDIFTTAFLHPLQSIDNA